jgi:hypothetical protein
MLRESSVAEITSAVRRVSSFSASRLEEMARQSWEHVRANHTRENFAKTYRDVIINIVSGGTRSTVGKNRVLEVVINGHQQ